MIKSFRDKDTEENFHQEFSKPLPKVIAKVALRKLMMIDGAETLSDLKLITRQPPRSALW